MRCSKCGNEYADDLRACPRCGELNPIGQTGAQVQGKTASAALILAVLSMCIPYAGIVLGILAFVQAMRVKAAYPKGSANYMLAQTAFIVGIVGTIVAVFTALLSVWMFQQINEAVQAVMYENGLLN